MEMSVLILIPDIKTTETINTTPQNGAVYEQPPVPQSPIIPDAVPSPIVPKSPAVSPSFAVAEDKFLVSGLPLLNFSYIVLS